MHLGHQTSNEIPLKVLEIGRFSSIYTSNDQRSISHNLKGALSNSTSSGCVLKQIIYIDLYHKAIHTG